MIAQFKRTCLDTIDKASIKLADIQSKYHSVLPKNLNHALNSIINDISLLKDNFVLIITKVQRLSNQCAKNQQRLLKIQTQYRNKIEQAYENHRLLEHKHDKATQQLNFMKYSNRNLRMELTEHQNCNAQIAKLRQTVNQIKQLVSSNSQDLVSKIVEIVATNIDENYLLRSSLKFDKETEVPCHLNFEEDHKNQKHTDELGQIKISSCQMKGRQSEKNSTVEKTKKKPPLTRPAFDSQDGSLTNKKTRSDLAQLIEQQSRMAKINERYMSTNIV